MKCLAKENAAKDFIKAMQQKRGKDLKIDIREREIDYMTKPC
ncbi:hypothetical protein SCACP_38910 [Sporomusa carbonis]